MAEVAANLLVKVGADISDAQKKLNTVGDSISNFGKSALKVGGMMTAGITTPLAIVGSQLVSFASDLDETRNKAVVVFGDQATALEEWAATASTTFGLSTQAALDYTGSLGNMMVQLGATTGEALTFSQEMVGAAADLASFHNAAGGSAEVLDTMSAAFRGEYDAIQRYIPTINAAAVEQQALAMTGKETAKELTAMEKAMAAQQIILQNMGPAAGDFARTSDGLANSQRILKAELDNVMATLGQQLLPIFSQVVGLVSQAVTWFSNLDPTIQTVILAVAGLAAVAGPVVTAIGAIGVVIGALASPIGIVVAAIAALAAAWATDFGGIRTTVTAFWEQHLKPIFDTLVVWLQENIPVALAALADYWENTLQPAIQVVWEFLQDNVFPILEALVNIYIAAAKVELAALAAIWVNVLQPALVAVWNFLQQNIIPIIVALVEVNIAALKLALTALAALWVNVLQPAIDIVWGILQNNIIPTFVDLKAKLDGPVTNALNAIARVFGTVAEAIGALSGVISGVIGWLGSLIDKANAALALLAKLGGGGKGMSRETLGGVSASATATNDIAKDAAALANALKALVDAFTAVAQYSGSQIGPQLNRLFDQLKGAFFKLEKLALWLRQNGIDAAVTLAEAGGKIGRALTGMVDGFAAVAAYAPQVIGPTLNRLFDQLHGVVYKLGKVAALFDDDALDASVVFAEAASKILGMVKEAIEVFERLRNYTTPGIEAINRFERDMQYALERWVRWVTLTLQPLAEDLSDETAGLVEGVVLAMGAALETLAGLVTYVSPAETAINEFIDDLGALFTAFHDWAVGEGGSEGSPGMLLEIPPELLAIFQDTMDSLGTAVDTLTALTDYSGPADEAIAAFIADMGALFTAFYGWAMGEGGSEGSPGMLMDIPPELLAVFEAVMSGLGAAVDTLTGLVDYVGPSEDAINTFTSDYALLFEGFADWAQTTFADVTFDTTAAVADVFGDVMTGLADAVTTLTALVDYAGPSNLAIQEFEADYQRLFAGFVAWAQTVLTAEAAVLVGAVGEALNSVFTGLGAAVQTLVGIVGYVGPSESAINRFETDYQRLMTGFRQWAMTAWTVEVAAVVQAVGDAANSLFTGLGAAATLLIAIRSYTSPAQTAIDGFVADLQALMLTMRDFATGAFTTDSLAILNTFSTVAQNLFTAMGTALDTMAAIADYTVSDSQFVLALQRFNQNLYTAIHSWQVWIIDIMAPETVALVAAFSGVLGDIVTGFRDALNLLMDIEAANLPTTEDLQAFLDALNTLFTAVVSNFQQVSVDLAQAGFDIQTVLYGIFNNINPQLWQAGLQTGAHFIGGLVQSMTSVSIITPLLNAMIDLANQLEDVLRAAWGISSPSKVAKRIGGQFVTGLEQGLQDLYGIPDMMRDALGMPALGLSYEPAPQRAFLTVRFEGAYQTGMSPREEARITTAMVNELRRQGVALATR